MYKPPVKPDISVIICHHAGSLILRCLKSLETAKGNFEIILVTSMPEFNYQMSNLTLLREEGGPAHKRNVGAKIARGKYLVFLDDDVEIREDCLSEFLIFLQDRTACGMAFAKILKMDRRDVFDDCGSWLTWTGFLWARAGNDIQDIGQYNDPQPILGSKSATCMIRSDVFHQVGKFDEDMYILGEETDLAWRCWHAGYEVWYAPSAVSWHAFGTSLKPPAEYYSLSRIHYLGARNYCWLLLANLPLTTLAYTLPTHIFVWLVAGLGFLLKGEFVRGGLILRGILHGLGSWGKICSKRRLVWQLRHPYSYSPPASYYLKRLTRYLIQGLHG